MERHGVDAATVSDARALHEASAAILPGDGAFGATMAALGARGLDVAVDAFIERGSPFLGICVGMQLLFECSTEFGGGTGFGVLHGAVERFERAPRVPHIGWNHLEPLRAHPLLERVGEDAYVYFLHSYRAPLVESAIAAATHGERFSAIVANDNVMGTQFHPEKSRLAGARLLDNFVRFAKKAA